VEQPARSRLGTLALPAAGRCTQPLGVSAAAAAADAAAYTARRYQCSICNGSGHNAQTCKRRSTVAAAVAARMTQGQPTMQAAAAAAAADKTAAAAVEGDVEVLTTPSQSHSRTLTQECNDASALFRPASAAVAPPKTPSAQGDPRRHHSALQTRASPQCSTCKEFGHLAKTCERRRFATHTLAQRQAAEVAAMQAAAAAAATAAVKRARPAFPSTTLTLAEEKEQGNSLYRKGDMAGALAAYSRCLALTLP